jgi:glutamate-1-semialdehyde 2,1-aminomutase
VVKTRLDVFDRETSKLAERYIAQTSLTNSKRPESFVKGVYPTHVLSGNGCVLTDTTGKKYVDFICGLGTNLLGYGNLEISGAVTTAFRSGATLSLSTVEEIKIAQKIEEIMPFVERLKIVKTGSEGCTAAVRIARAYTKRDLILSEGYHGWHDELASLMPPALGISGKFNIEKFTPERIKDAAAVILEPVITDWSRHRIEALRQLSEDCKKHKTLLIFDETITALRFPNFCVANYAGVKPDLMIFGKALGGGMPISIVGGRSDVMNCGEYFVSGSFCGERTSIAAGLKTIELLQKKNNIQDLWDNGSVFIKTFNEMNLGVQIEGYPTRGVLKGDELPKALFMQEACKAGLLFGASWFYSFPHIKEFAGIFSTLKQVELKLKIGNVRLEGELPKSPFAQKMREK